MLHSCGHALSQGDGSDFYPGCNWEATPPGYSACESLQMIGSTGPCLPGLTMAAQKSWKNMGLLAGVANCGRSQKWGCRERLALGFKPRHGSHARLGPLGFGESQDHVALGFPLPLSLGSQKARCSNDAELFLRSLEECKRNTAGKKGMKGLLLVGHEKVPRGFGLRTGD